MKNLIIGTAGHIDHGKTALVRALTGIDADRLEEEKRRGITIDIGFAHIELGGYRIGFIDVPGHEKFVKNMLAGIGGVRMVLLVVAADESVMPQTREHFHICRLLQIERGIVVLTKKNLVDPELLELVEAEVEELTVESFLEGAPVIAVDSLSGEGIEELRECILSQLGELDLESEERRARKRLFRLPIDRVFSVKGFGTVVTGTALAGELDQDEFVELHPGGERVKIRGVQVFNEKVEQALPGQRTALNLTGVETDEVNRGMILASPAGAAASSVFDVEIHLLEGSPTPLKYRSPIRFHHGSAEIIGRVYPLEAASIEPGHRGVAQIRLDQPTLCFPGDRFVLRRYSPLLTVGGGWILENAPARHRRRDLEALVPHLRTRARLVERPSANGEAELLGLMVEQAGWSGLGLAALVARSGYRPEVISDTLREEKTLIQAPLDPPVYLSRGSFRKLGERVKSFLEAFHSRDALAPGVSREELKSRFLPESGSAYFQFLLALLEKNETIEVRGSVVALPGKSAELTGRQEEIKQKLLERIEAGAFQPSSLEELATALPFSEKEVKDVFYFLLRREEIIKISEEFFLLPTQLERVMTKTRRSFPPGDSFGVPEFKDLFSLSRKYAIPLLEFLDRRRVTRRQGDRRIVLE